MYPNAIVAEAVERLFHSRYPFDQLETSTLADLGVDRHGEFVDPNDARRSARAPARRPSHSLLGTLRSVLSAPWRRRPAL